MSARLLSRAPLVAVLVLMQLILSACRTASPAHIVKEPIPESERPGAAVPAAVKADNPSGSNVAPSSSPPIAPAAAGTAPTVTAADYKAASNASVAGHYQEFCGLCRGKQAGFTGEIPTYLNPSPQFGGEDGPASEISSSSPTPPIREAMPPQALPTSPNNSPSGRSQEVPSSAPATSPGCGHPLCPHRIPAPSVPQTSDSSGGGQKCDDCKSSAHGAEAGPTIRIDHLEIPATVNGRAVTGVTVTAQFQLVDSQVTSSPVLPPPTPSAVPLATPRVPPAANPSAATCCQEGQKPGACPQGKDCSSCTGNCGGKPAPSAAPTSQPGNSSPTGGAERTEKQTSALPNSPSWCGAAGDPIASGNAPFPGGSPQGPPGRASPSLTLTAQPFAVFLLIVLLLVVTVGMGRALYFDRPAGLVMLCGLILSGFFRLVLGDGVRDQTSLWGSLFVFERETEGFPWNSYLAFCSEQAIWVLSIFALLRIAWVHRQGLILAWNACKIPVTMPTHSAEAPRAAPA